MWAPEAAASIISPMIERPDTAVPFLRTQISALNWAAVLTKRAAARACTPRWLQILTDRRAVAVLSGAAASAAAPVSWSGLGLGSPSGLIGGRRPGAARRR